MDTVSPLPLSAASAPLPPAAQPADQPERDLTGIDMDAYDAMPETVEIPMDPGVFKVLKVLHAQ